MRFFAHYGKAVHGPAGLDELLKLPGFDGDTLVCPVGSENSADWKPALAYPPFREALLATAPKLTPFAAPLAPPPAASPSVSCPKCARSNPMDARFCNACAARMDGREEPRGPKRAMANAREPEPEPAVVAVESIPAELPAVSEPAPAWRKALAASAAGAVIASGGLGWWLLRPARRRASAAAVSPAPPAQAAPAETAPPAAVAAPAAVPAPEVVPAPAAPAPLAATAPPPPAPTAVSAPPAPRSPARRARRKARAKKAAPAPAPAAAPQKAAAEDGGFMLPGVPRRVPPKSATPPKPVAAAAPAPAAAEGDDDPASRQIREQFLFCTQLLAQGAFADHFDTCLCAAARQAAPFLGRRDAYAAGLKKAAAAGTLETTASVTGVAVDGAGAKVTADWMSGSATRTETENWRLEDGLWCRDP